MNLIIISTLFIFYGSSFACDIDTAKIPGRWVNVDATSDGVLEIIIDHEGDEKISTAINGTIQRDGVPLAIIITSEPEFITRPKHRFNWVGRTSPNPTKYKTSLISFIAENAGSEIYTKGMAIDSSEFMDKYFTFSIADSSSGHVMTLDTITIFKDSRRRSNYSSRDIFRYTK